MTIWKAYWQNDVEGCCVSWHASKDEAQQELDDALSEYDGENHPNSEPSGIEEMTVPTSKQGMVDWLNLNLNRENG